MEKEIEIEARKISDNNEALLSEMEKNLQAIGDDIEKIKEKIDTTLYQRETVFVNMVECKAQIDAIEALLSDIKTKYEIRTYAFEPENIVYKHSGLRIGVIPVSSDVNKEGTQNDLHGDLNLFSDGLITKAMFDYDAINDGDISFKKGDKLEVSEKESQNLDWWMARHLKTGQRGYIPGNYVRKDDNSPQSQDWWFDVTRKKAAKLLLLPGYPTGTFLVRESKDKVSFVLSIRAYDQKKSDAFVRHYRIHRLDNGGFYLNTRSGRTFDNVPDLISHYRKAASGTWCRLEMACPKTPPLVPFRVLEVARESVKLLKKLQDGSGCFGEVYAAKLHNTVDVAVKIFKQGQGTTDDFLAEAKLMNQLRHNRLVQLIAVCTKPKPIWIITELMSNGSLLKYLREDDGKLLYFPQLTYMACQIADGMAYLETKKIVHRDLRAANILVGDYGEVKVANFGLARLIQGDIYKAEAGGVADTAFPLKWTAPEAVFDRKFSIKSDVWSYGVLLYELITFGRVPYPECAIQATAVFWQSIRAVFDRIKPVHMPKTSIIKTSESRC